MAEPRQQLPTPQLVELGPDDYIPWESEPFDGPAPDISPEQALLNQRLFEKRARAIKAINAASKKQ